MAPPETSLHDESIQAGEAQPQAAPSQKSPSLAEVYLPSLILQFVLLIAGLIATDSFCGYRVILGGIVAHGLGVWLIAARRRPKRLTQGDVIYIRYGFFLFYILSGVFLSFWLDLARRLHWAWLIKYWVWLERF